MTTGITLVSRAGQRQQTSVDALLTPVLHERARVETNAWIKRLRHVPYGAVTMRERFSYRGDSLWWFTELYLQKMRRLDRAMAVVLALEAAREHHDAASVIVSDADLATRAAARAFGEARGMPVTLEGPAPQAAALASQSALIGLGAWLSRLRPRIRLRAPHGTKVAAFVHTAFWRAGDADRPDQEGYIGPVLDELAERLGHLGPNGLYLVGVGPRRNFRARRWWDGLASGPAPVTPIERLAPQRALAGSLALWRSRRDLAEAVVSGAGIREAAVVRGVDLWPVLRPELEAVARVQWPWSARAMDEAAAALDALAPDTIVTYAEAGGWGRALMLEARRRGMRSVGLQHGFIYRHWLNYLHEADEMAAVGDDAGFPRPDLTLLFDRYASEHLEIAGHFPAASLRVSGSPRLDELVARAAACSAVDREDARFAVGASPQQRLIVLVSKFSEVKDALPALVAAVRQEPLIRLAIKAHPAEIGDVYTPLVDGIPNISVAQGDADLRTLVAAADGLVTMNSTVAIDAMALGVPSLVIGLPNNLSPFVEAGAMLGAPDAASMPGALRTLLYDLDARARLLSQAAAFVDRYDMRATGCAAGRAADLILGVS